MNMYVCVCMCVQVPVEDRRTRSLGIGGRRGCLLSDVGAGNQIEVLLIADNLSSTSIYIVKWKLLTSVI